MASCTSKTSDGVAANTVAPSVLERAMSKSQGNNPPRELLANEADTDLLGR